MKKDILELIKENTNLIYKIAGKYSSYSSIEDLYQVGVIGLLNAYKNFKEEYNTKFSTYAYTYIFGEIMEYIRKDKNLKLSKEYLSIYKKYIEVKEFLSQKLLKEPTIDEISLYLEIDSRRLTDILNSITYFVSLDNEKNEINMYEIIGEKEIKMNEEILDLKSVIENLELEEQQIIKCRYYKDYTQTETAKYLGMTQVQVSRNEAKTLKKIKQKLTS